MEKTTFNSEKMYTYIRGYASGLDMTQTLCALAFARKKHQGQMRKSGEPYIVHPLTMACDALSLGIKDDNTIATILLHDVCEDCGVSVAELPVNDVVKRGVELMTFTVMVGSFIATASNKVLEVTGGYSATFMMLLALSAVALILNIFIRRP